MIYSLTGNKAQKKRNIYMPVKHIFKTINKLANNKKRKEKYTGNKKRTTYK